MKYRKIPVEIEAVQFEGISNENGQPLFSEDRPEWLVNAFANELIRRHPVWPDTRLQVETAASDNRIVEVGDYIVSVGEPKLRVYKAEAFEAGYEKADEA